MGGLNQNDDNDDTFRGGVWDLNDDMMTQHNKVVATMIYHPLLMISILIANLFPRTNLSIIAPFIAGLILSLRWSVLVA